MGMRALRHPLALVAIATWLLNDHVLKGLWPGLVTGKLSDIAGMIVTPMLLTACIELVSPKRWQRSSWFRAVPWTCAAVVALAFAAAKTWAPANDLYGSAVTALRAPLRFALSRIMSITWSERTILTRDATDLVAVPFAAIAGVLHRHNANTLRVSCESPQKAG